MRPHLHPRSSATTTLFASTLAASFIIVGIPHIFPCPAPRKGYLDADGKLVRKRRKRKESDEVEGVDERRGQAANIGTDKTHSEMPGELDSSLDRVGTASDSASALDTSLLKGRQIGKTDRGGDEEEEDMGMLFREMKEEADVLESERRECPVPKPRGKIGEWLGFGRDGGK